MYATFIQIGGVVVIVKRNLPNDHEMSLNGCAGVDSETGLGAPPYAA